MPTIPIQYTQWHNIMLLELTCVYTFMCLKFILGKLDPSTPCIMSLIKQCYKQEPKSAHRNSTQNHILSLIQVLLNVTWVLWLQTCNYFILGWELLGWQVKAEKSLQKSVIFYQVALKAKKSQTKLKPEMPLQVAIYISIYWCIVYYTTL